MKKVKLVFWLIVVAFLVLVGIQNKAFFLQKHSFDLDFWVTAPYQIPEVEALKSVSDPTMPMAATVSEEEDEEMPASADETAG